MPQHLLAVHDIDAFGQRAEVSRRSCAAAIKMIDGRSGFSFNYHLLDAALHIFFHYLIGIPRLNLIVRWCTDGHIDSFEGITTMKNFPSRCWWRFTIYVNFNQTSQLRVEKNVCLWDRATAQGVRFSLLIQQGVRRHFIHWFAMTSAPIAILSSNQKHGHRYHLPGCLINPQRTDTKKAWKRRLSVPRIEALPLPNQIVQTTSEPTPIWIILHAEIWTRVKQIEHTAVTYLSDGDKRLHAFSNVELTNEAWAEISLLNLCLARREKTMSTDRARVCKRLFQCCRASQRDTSKFTQCSHWTGNRRVSSTTCRHWRRRFNVRIVVEG